MSGEATVLKQIGIAALSALIVSGMLGVFLFKASFAVMEDDLGEVIGAVSAITQVNSEILQAMQRVEQGIEGAEEDLAELNQRVGALREKLTFHLSHHPDHALRVKLSVLEQRVSGLER